MVAIRQPMNTNSAGLRLIELTDEGPEARRLVVPDLPRSRRSELPTGSGGGNSLFSKLGRFMRNNERTVGAVMLGATVLPLGMGMATTAMAHAPASSVFNDSMNADERYEAFKRAAAEINAKRGVVPFTELQKQMEDLFKDFARNGNEHASLRTDGDRDGVNLAREVLFGIDDAKVDTDGDGMGDGFEISKGLDPADAQRLGKTDVKTWTHGYIPMSNNPMIEGYTLLNYDLLMKDRTGHDPHTRYAEGASGIDGGHYFLSSTLDESNAELTAAMDFNGDGVLTPGVKHDLLKPGLGDADFGTDGKTDTKLSVGWWGHCNNVATAGINFREPTQPVTFTLAQPHTVYLVETSHGSFKADEVKTRGNNTDIKLISGQTVRLKSSEVTNVTKQEIKEVTFSATALKELAAELTTGGSSFGNDFVGARFNGRPATIVLNDGTTLRGGITSSLTDRATVTENGGWSRATKFTSDVTASVWDWNEGKYVDKTFKAEDIKSIDAENKRDVNPIDFHLTMIKWLGSDGTAGVMDKDAGPHVWNYAFDKYEYEGKAREDAPNTVDYQMKVWFVGNGYPSTYSYALTFDDAGKPVSGTWADSSSNPDFFWRERGGTAGYEHTHNKAGLDFKTVIELLQKSYAAEDAATPPPATNPN